MTYGDFPSWVFIFHLHLISICSHLEQRSSLSDKLSSYFLFLTILHRTFTQNLIFHVCYQWSFCRLWHPNLLSMSHTDLNLDLSFFIGSILCLYQTQALIIILWALFTDVAWYSDKQEDTLGGHTHTHTHTYTHKMRGCPRGVMVKAMDCGIVVREFVLQSRYYIHFRANTLGKVMNPLILLAMG